MNDVKRIVRHELDEFRDSTILKATKNKCEGSCEKHSGNVKAVRVFDKNTGFDWGYFSYCENAVAEDIEHRGMILDDA